MRGHNRMLFFSRLLIAIIHSSRRFASFAIKAASLNKSQMKNKTVAVTDYRKS